MITKLIKIFLVVFLFFMFSIGETHAINTPTSVTNNKYGIHITDESDIDIASELVNSSGGDWGYVTFVIREDERDSKRWQTFFDHLRRKHLIPIVRIASKQGDGYWEKLNVDEIDGWVGFLNSLNWVIQNRYVVVGNEVNLGHEWGGKANAAEYTNYLNTFSSKLRSWSPDYFIMAAGLDPNAKNNDKDIHEENYIAEMIATDNQVFNKMDGLSSHSYPYKTIGEGSDFGTLKNYEWELSILRSKGTTKELPVFITETGWRHGRGQMSYGEISEAIEDAANTIWNDPKIIAVTPFLLKYPSAPFEQFSWMNSQGGKYSFFETYKNISKLKGVPVQLQSGEVISYMLPRFIRTKFNNIYGLMYLKNTGQTIWKGYSQIPLIINDKRTIIKPITILGDVEPGHKSLAVYSIK